MNTQWMRLCAAITISATAMLATTLVCAQTVKECSYTAVNGSCKLTIYRSNPVAPPTIYVRHGEKIKIIVNVPDCLQFEHLTMDLKSSATQVPQDQFQNGFSALTTALSGFTISEPELPAQVPLVKVAPPPPPAPGSLEDIKKRQSELEEQAKGAIGERNGLLTKWAIKVLGKIHDLFQPISSTAVTPHSSTPPWDDVKAAFDGGDADPALGSLIVDDFKTKLAQLDADIADLADKKAATAGQLLVINAKEKELQTYLDRFTTLKKKLRDLKDFVDKPPEAEPSTFTISDLQPTEQNNIVQTWDLNAANKLAVIAGKVKLDKYPDDVAAAQSSITDVPTKQLIAEFRIQFMNQPRFEISSGLLVPFKPYHTYSVGLTQAAVSATPPGTGVVQQTLSNAVVPDASVNFLLGNELVVRKQRFAFMATIAAGYNTATTSAAFAFGPSIAWRSIMISPLVVVDRDQQLAGGYVLGQSAGTATTPMTTNVWRFGPSIGISLRIPLSGASK